MGASLGTSFSLHAGAVTQLDGRTGCWHLRACRLGTHADRLDSSRGVEAPGCRTLYIEAVAGSPAPAAPQASSSTGTRPSQARAASPAASAAPALPCSRASSTASASQPCQVSGPAPAGLQQHACAVPRCTGCWVGPSAADTAVTPYLADLCQHTCAVSHCTGWCAHPSQPFAGATIIWQAINGMRALICAALAAQFAHPLLAPRGPPAGGGRLAASMLSSRPLCTRVDASWACGASSEPCRHRDQRSLKAWESGSGVPCKLKSICGCGADRRRPGLRMPRKAACFGVASTGMVRAAQSSGSTAAGAARNAHA